MDRLLAWEALCHAVTTSTCVAGACELFGDWYYFNDSIDFDLVTIVFLVVGVVLLPVILLILVAVLHECGKRCTQRRQGGNGICYIGDCVSPMCMYIHACAYNYICNSCIHVLC